MGDDDRRHATEPLGTPEFAATVAASDGLAPDALAATAAGVTAPLMAPSVLPAPFAPYDRIEVLAEQGSIGLVARGHNVEFGRWELLKFLRTELAEDPEIARQFKREGRVLAQLAHPNVVQVFATYDVGGRTCLAMEFLAGRPLDGLVDDHGPITDGVELARLFLDAAQGLHAAHEMGLLHRDLKPENLFVVEAGKGRQGGLKLIDFGLATADRTRVKPGDHDPALFSATTGGTPLFMAPELWRGDEATAAADLYALGMTFYRVASGDYPFPVETLDGVRAAILDPAPFPSLARAAPDLPVELVDLVDALVAKDPRARPASAREVVAVLRAGNIGRRRRVVPDDGPFVAGRPHGFPERDVFFGREREIDELVTWLRKGCASVVVGPQSCGKTSLVLAGVVPRLVEQGLGRDDVTFGWAQAVLGKEPGTDVARALAAVVDAPVDALIDAIARRPETVAARLEDALPEGRGVVLVVDGLERIRTARRPGEASAVLRTLTSFRRAPASGRVRLVGTLAAEDVDDLLRIDGARDLLDRQLYPLTPLSGEALRRAVVSPPRVAGATIDDGAVVDEIVDGERTEPIGLKMIGEVLTRWWHRCDGSRLTRAAWDAMGGLAGGLQAHADAVVDGLPDEVGASARAVLCRLVSGSGDRAVVARKVLEQPAVSGIHGAPAVAGLLAGGVLEEVPGGLRLIHGSLARDWPMLRALLEAERADQALRDDVVGAAELWERGDRGPGLLWHGAAARRLAAWFPTSRVALDQSTLAFVEATGQARRRRLWWSVGAATTALAVVVALAASLIGSQSTASERQHELTAQLAAERASAATARMKADLELAGEVLQHDPRRAVALAHRWRKLRPGVTRALLDRARQGGLPVPVPGPLTNDGEPGRVASVAFDPDGEHLISASPDGAVRLPLHPPAKDEPAFRPIDVRGWRPRTLHRTDDGVLLLSTDGKMGWLDGTTVRPMAAPCTGEGLRGLKGTATGAIVHCAGKVVLLTAKGAPTTLFEGEFTGLGVSPRGRRVAVWSVDPVDERPGAGDQERRGRVRVIDVEEGAILADVVVPSLPAEVGGGPAGRRVAVTDGGTRAAVSTRFGPIQVLDWSSSPPRWQRLPADGVVRATFDDAFIAVGGYRATLLDGRAERHGLNVAGPLVVTLGPHRRVVASRDDGRLTVADLVEPSVPRAAIGPGSGEAVAVVADPAGRYLVTLGVGTTGATLLDLDAVLPRSAPRAGGPCALAHAALAHWCVDGDRLVRITLAGRRDRSLPWKRAQPFRAAAAFTVGPEGAWMAWRTDDELVVRQQEVEHRHALAVQAIAVEREGPIVFGRRGDRVVVERHRNGQLTEVGTLAADVRDVHEAPGGRFAVLLVGGALVMVEPTTGKVEKEADIDEATAIAVSPQGAIAFADARGGVRYEVDGSFSKPVKVAQPVAALAWSAAGGHLVVTHGGRPSDANVDVVDLETRRTTPLPALRADAVRRAGRHFVFTTGQGAPEAPAVVVRRFDLRAPWVDERELPDADGKLVAPKPDTWRGLLAR